MPAAMPYSPWSGLPEKTISMPRSDRSDGTGFKTETPVTSNKVAGINGGPRAGAASIRRNGKAHTITIKPVLDPAGSAALRDQLLTDVDRLSSADAAATWAHRILAAKNSLAAADARQVEDAFAAKMATLGSSDEEVTAPLSSSESGQPRLSQNPRAAEPSEIPSPTASTRACSRYRSRAGFGTRPTANSWPNSPV